MARPRREGRTIDFKSWDAMPSVSAQLTADGSTAVAGLAFTSPATILRCRGSLLYSLDESQQVNDKMKVGLGLGIISSDAFTASTLPDPSGEAEYPWLWWHEVQLGSDLAVGINNLGQNVARIDLDTKAMRKIKPGQTLTLVTQYVDLTGTPVLDQQQGQIRVLIGT